VRSASMWHLNRVVGGDAARPLVTPSEALRLSV